MIGKTDPNVVPASGGLIKNSTTNVKMIDVKERINIDTFVDTES